MRKLLMLTFFIGLSYIQGQTQNEYWAGFIQQVDISPYEGLPFKVEAAVKITADIEVADAEIWARIHKKDGTTGYVNRTEVDKYKHKGNWTIYTLEGKIDEQADFMAIGGYTAYNGQFYFDDFKLSILKNGQWENVALENGNFEDTTFAEVTYNGKTFDKKMIKGWGGFIVFENRATFMPYATQDVVYEGKNALLIEGKGFPSLPTLIKKFVGEWETVFIPELSENTIPNIAVKAKVSYEALGAGYTLKENILGTETLNGNESPMSSDGLISIHPDLNKAYFTEIHQNRPPSIYEGTIDEKGNLRFTLISTEDPTKPHSFTYTWVNDDEMTVVREFYLTEKQTKVKVHFRTVRKGREVSKIQSSLQEADVRMPMQFLASDELQGRNTGTVYANMAARFIAEQFQYAGVAPIGEDYFQQVDLIKITPDNVGGFGYPDKIYTHGENLLFTMGKSIKKDLDFVFIEQGWVDSTAGRDDYKGIDVKGKIVLSIPGISKGEEAAFPAGLEQAFQKKVFAKAKGAIGLIEIFPYGAMLWNTGKQIYTNPQVQLASTEKEIDDGFIFGFILPDHPDFLAKLKAQKIIKNIPFSFENNSKKEALTSKNVIGLVKGTDPILSKEHIILTAHYDHIGTRAAINETDTDTIFNGSRDNAMGTVALLSAAKILAKNPPKRSIIFAAFTGEEAWFLGSKQYTNHPLIPLNQTVFNLNADGASYNNTSLVTIFGHDQFDDLSLLEKGCAPFGLTTNADPAPAQNLFQRSDNFSFAQKGIPAPTFSIGFDDFNDEKVLNYYHQVTDNPNTIDYDYLRRYSQAFSHTSWLLGNAEKLPYWKTDSPFEVIGNSLYAK